MIEFTGAAVRRDLVGDCYPYETGDQLWTGSQHNEFYAYPEFFNKSQVTTHLHDIHVLRIVLKADVDNTFLVAYNL